MKVLSKRLEVAEGKLDGSDDLEEKYIDERVEYFTTGDKSVFKTPCPSVKKSLYYYHKTMGKMKEKGLEVHPSFRAKLNNKVQESKNGLNKK